MKRQVVVITGSPRQGGNSDRLADAFIKGAKDAGHEVAKFSVIADPVQPCTACNACWSKGRACVFEDGFVRLAPLLEKADAIVWCGPLYWATYGAQLKAAIDKLYAFGGEAPKKKLKAKMFLMMSAANPAPEIFSAVKSAYQTGVAHLGLVNGGEILVPGVRAVGDIEQTGALERAEQLGRAMV